ncbi:hypothetical protein NQD34_006023 [Periophthalmus magnuspinnatus]|nr:hypothetical protein NQD34_006023 [Periophthalmus magnuspinnatus]
MVKSHEKPILQNRSDLNRTSFLQCPYTCSLHFFSNPPLPPPSSSSSSSSSFMLYICTALVCFSLKFIALSSRVTPPRSSFSFFILKSAANETGFKQVERGQG